MRAFASSHDHEAVVTQPPVIGVLTKPDRIQHGEENDWLGFIRNIREPLANGWFAVKQPDSRALRAGVNWMDARASEDDFFRSKLPWSALDADYQRRLRTSNLTRCLSAILSELITKRWVPLLHKNLTLH